MSQRLDVEQAIPLQNSTNHEPNNAQPPTRSSTNRVELCRMMMRIGPIGAILVMGTTYLMTGDFFNAYSPSLPTAPHARSSWDASAFNCSGKRDGHWIMFDCEAKIFKCAKDKSPFPDSLVKISYSQPCVPGQDSLARSCTGFLPTTKHVITAAHCLVAMVSDFLKCSGLDRQEWLNDNRRVILPSNYFTVTVHRPFGSVWGGCQATEVKVHSVVVHEEYKVDTTHSISQHDIGFLNLAHELDPYTHAIGTICMPDIFFNHDGQQAIIAGFGMQEDEIIIPDQNNNPTWGSREESGTNIAREAAVPLVDDSWCDEQLGAFGYNSTSHLCAGSFGKGVNSGDSGSPLLIAYSRRMFAVGVASNRGTFNKERQPDTFIRIDEHCDWLSEKSNGTIECTPIRNAWMSGIHRFQQSAEERRLHTACIKTLADHGKARFAEICGCPTCSTKKECLLRDWSIE